MKASSPWMAAVPWIASVLWGATAVVGCAPQSNSTGSNTNWLRACQEDAECGGEASCLCGLCSRTCESDSTCGPGSCGTEKATAAQCGGAGHDNLCLPEASVCAGTALVADGTLGAGDASGCENAADLLCESFDTALSSDYSTWQGGDIAAAVQPCRARLGAGSLHLSSPGYGYSQTRMSLATPVASGGLHVRFYAYLPSAVPVAPYFEMLELWHQETTNPDKLSIQVIDGDRLEVLVGPNGTVHATADAGIARDRWQCIELSFVVDPTAGSLSLQVDGTSLLEETGIVTAAPAPYSVAVMEMVSDPSQLGLELFLDELVISTAPIGCL